MSKAQEFIDFLNAAIKATGYNERQVPANAVHFSLMQGKKYARVVQDGGGSRSSYAFVDVEGNIYKSAGWSAPAKGVRSTVDDVLGGKVGFFESGAFEKHAYSTIWLYA